MPAIFSVTSAELTAWLTAFLWPFVRMLALVSTAPVFGEPGVARQIKVAIAALLAVAIAPTLGPMPAVPVVSAGGVWIIVQQVLIGGAIGFTMRMVFAAVLAAGEYIGLQMGLSFASFFDPMAGGATMVVARLMHMLAILLFLAVDGHLLMLAALAESFHTLPIADAPLAAQGWMLLVSGGGSPQFSIFAVGFPLTLLAGIGMLQLLMPQLGAFLEPRFAAALSSLPQLMQALRP
ncbi:MAG: flagellar biosynthetic protein FliR [Variovorax paradoxus]|nr:flagellar biosynthetic protein FliR [Variovorax paradoxus]MBW8719956.1 flagellar biosynthetic protein FliR [Variovorax paradoxus]